MWRLSNDKGQGQGERCVVLTKGVEGARGWQGLQHGVSVSPPV